MPFPVSHDFAVEKNKLESLIPFVHLLKFEAFSHSNLFLYSQAWNTGWTKSNVTLTDNNVAAPDDTSTGCRAQVTVANGYIYQQYAIADPENRTFTFSFFVKNYAVGATMIDFNSPQFTVRLRRGDNSDETVWTGPEIVWTPMVNGWFRGKVTKKFSASTSGDNVRAVILSSQTGYFYLWGAMLEQTSSPTFYIPTTTVTRTVSYHCVTSYSRFLTFNGDCYTPFPIKLGGDRAGTKGETPSISLQVSNVGRYLTSFMRDNKGMVGKSITWYYAHPNFLNVGDVIQQEYIVMSSGADDTALTFSMGIGVTAMGIEGPIGSFDRQNCPYMPAVIPRISMGLI